MIKREEEIIIHPTIEELAKEIATLNDAVSYSSFLNELGRCLNLYNKELIYCEGMLNDYGKIALSKIANPMRIPDMMVNPYE